MEARVGGRFTWVTSVALAVVVGCLLMASGARAGTMVDVPATAGPADIGGTGFVDTGVSVQGSASISATGTIDIGYGANPGDNPDGATKRQRVQHAVPGADLHLLVADRPDRRRPVAAGRIGADDGRRYRRGVPRGRRRWRQRQLG